MSASGPQSNRSIESASSTKAKPESSSVDSSSREARFFVNDKPVKVSEPRPSVRAVCQAAGYDPADYRIYRLSQQDDPTGREIEDLDERLHATADKPVYLRCQKKDQRAPIAAVAPGPVGGLVGDLNRPLNMSDLEPSPSRPRDYARDVDGDAPGGPPRPE